MGAVAVLVFYPLLMVFAAAVAPAFSHSQALELSDLFSERLRAASINPLRLGVAVSLLSLMTGAALALLAAQTRHERWIDLMMSVPFLASPAWSLAVGPKGYLGRFGFFGRELEHMIFSFWGSRAADGGSLRADCLLCRSRADRGNTVIALVGRADRRSRDR